MYFMNICTWDPKDEKEVVERRKKWHWPSKAKVVFEFLDLQGCRVINVIDTDEKGLIASRSDWVDILKFETFPIYPIGDTKQAVTKYNATMSEGFLILNGSCTAPSLLTRKNRHGFFSFYVFDDLMREPISADFKGDLCGDRDIWSWTS